MGLVQLVPLSRHFQLPDNSDPNHPTGRVHCRPALLSDVWSCAELCTVPLLQYTSERYLERREDKLSPGEAIKVEIRGGKMGNRGLLFLPALLLLSGVLCGASAVDPIPTYEHQDRSTGKILQCNKCPPGNYMGAHCTATSPTRCYPCIPDYYTELWNYMPMCLYCSNLCSENQEVEKECSSTSNTVCRCKEGFYASDDFCFPHSECGPGQGVLTKGTLQKDTVCEHCPDGYFSNSSSTSDLCVKHQECPSTQLVLLHGSAYHDTVCGSCEDLANGGDTLRTFLSTFFSSHRMRVRRMKRFIHKYIQKSGEDRCATLPKKRGPLLDIIREWLVQAPEEELRKLPAKLKACDLRVMAEKLEKRLTEIKHGSLNCTLSI
ncbi:tumor necrosis factor receptor superfamily member 6B-like [Mugil cephalus]|uniref:tumor necrosis factor receptor superfamily member 6B-like n=1 Tax=Mugil cephalus TaxID=48193 RepID=UPI001FB7E2D6|nr:tumor necrosis factor receptor superfamily member 6B-like [Mugil cephalus]